MLFICSWNVCENSVLGYCRKNDTRCLFDWPQTHDKKAFHAQCPAGCCCVLQIENGNESQTKMCRFRVRFGSIFTSGKKYGQFESKRGHGTGSAPFFLQRKHWIIMSNNFRMSKSSSCIMRMFNFKPHLCRFLYSLNLNISPNIIYRKILIVSSLLVICPVVPSLVIGIFGWKFCYHQWNLSKVSIIISWHQNWNRNNLGFITSKL